MSTADSALSLIRLVVDPAPEDAPPQTLGRLRRLDVAGRDLSAPVWLADPLAPEERELLHWYLVEFPRWPYGGYAARARVASQAMEAIGRALYQSAFGDISTCDLRTLCVESSLPAAQQLPWELLHDGSRYLALAGDSPPLSIVRRIPGLPAQPSPAPPSPFASPLRVLLVTARPADPTFPRLDERVVARRLFDRLEAAIGAGSVVVEVLRPPTIEAFEQRLAATPAVHILHFDGHGVAESSALAAGSSSGPALVFEGARGRAHFVPADRFARAAASVPLVVLTACETAKAGDDRFHSMARALVEAGVQAVIAMSDDVRVDTAAAYADALYRALAGGMPLATAHATARGFLGARAEFNADWWTPQLFLQREMGPPIVAAGSALPPASAPATPPPAFVGRADELISIGRLLQAGEAVALRGFGGIGKTALAGEAAGWLVRTGLCARSQIISGTAVAAPDLVAALDAVAADAPPGLSRLLVVVDGIDEVAFTADEEQVAQFSRLCDALEQLADRCALIITMRDLSERPLLLGPIKGRGDIILGPLAADDALAFTLDVLHTSAIDPSRFTRDALETLLRALGCHPLGIALLVPELARLTPEALAELLDHGLPAAAAPPFKGRKEGSAEPGGSDRNRSLQASLAASLARLSAAERALLPAFAPFAGFGNLRSLRNVSAIDSLPFDGLVEALCRAGLARREKLTNLAAGTLPCLQFHPFLAPHLRSLPGDGALAHRYVQEYGDLAQMLFLDPAGEDRGLAARLYARERPNFRRAAALAAAVVDARSAAEIQARILALAGRFGDRLDAFSVAVPATSASTAAEVDRARQALRLLEAVPQPDRIAFGKAETVLGLALQRDGHPDEAVTRLQAAVAKLHDPSPGIQPELRLQYELGAWMGLGSVLHQQQGYADARAAYARWLDLGTEVRADGSARLIDPAAAVQVHLELGNVARRLQDWEAAAREYGTVLDRVHLRATDAERAAAYFGLADAAMFRGDLQTAEDRLRDAVDACRRAGDQPRVTSAYLGLGRLAVQRQAGDEAETWFRAALASAGMAAVDAETQAFQYVTIAGEYLILAAAGSAGTRRRLDFAADLGRQALAARGTDADSRAADHARIVLLAIAEAGGPPCLDPARAGVTQIEQMPAASRPARAKALLFLARALRQAGRIEEAIAPARAACADFEAVTGDGTPPPALVQALLDALQLTADILCQRERYGEARELYERWLARDVKADGAAAVRVHLQLALIGRHSGDTHLARSHAEVALALARTLPGAENLQAVALSNLAAVAQMDGDLAAARDRTGEMLDVYRGLGDQANITTAQIMLGIIAVQEGEPAHARDYFDTALASPGLAAKDEESRAAAQVIIAQQYGLLAAQRMGGAAGKTGAVATPEPATPAGATFATLDEEARALVLAAYDLARRAYQARAGVAGSAAAANARAVLTAVAQMGGPALPPGE